MILPPAVETEVKPRPEVLPKPASTAMSAPLRTTASQSAARHKRCSRTQSPVIAMTTAGQATKLGPHLLIQKED